MYWRSTRQVRQGSVRENLDFGSEEQRLRTKIVATIGRADQKRYDPNLELHESVTFDELFKWFRQPTHQDCLVVDVVRLNMSFYDDGHKDVYESVFKWFENEKDELAKNTCILCDLAGAKIRLGRIYVNDKEDKVMVHRGEHFKLHLSENIRGDATQASVLVSRQSSSVG